MKEVSEKHMKDIFLNVLKAILVMLYFFILAQCYENVSANNFERVTQIVTMLILFVTIYLFEKAYKEDNEVTALHGIEILMLATYTLTTEYITKKYKFPFKNYSYAASYLFASYFIMKCIIIYTKGRKEIADSRSDVREIVKKNDPVIREATKKKMREVYEEAKKAKEKANNNEKKPVAKKTATTKKTPTKKTTTGTKTTTTRKPTSGTRTSSAKKTQTRPRTATTKATGTKKVTTTKGSATRKSTTTKRTTTKRTTNKVKEEV